MKRVHVNIQGKRVWTRYLVTIRDQREYDSFREYVQTIHGFRYLISSNNDNEVVSYVVFDVPVSSRDITVNVKWTARMCKSNHNKMIKKMKTKYTMIEEIGNSPKVPDLRDFKFLKELNIENTDFFTDKLFNFYVNIASEIRNRIEFNFNRKLHFVFGSDIDTIRKYVLKEICEKKYDCIFIGRNSEEEEVFQGVTMNAGTKIAVLSNWYLTRENILITKQLSDFISIQLYIGGSLSVMNPYDDIYLISHETPKEVILRLKDVNYIEKQDLLSLLGRCTFEDISVPGEVKITRPDYLGSAWIQDQNYVDWLMSHQELLQCNVLPHNVLRSKFYAILNQAAQQSTHQIDQSNVNL